MKNYEVTMYLIIGYVPEKENEPILIRKEVFVNAKNESQARAKARQEDESKLSIWETYASEVKY